MASQLPVDTDYVVFDLRLITARNRLEPDTNGNFVNMFPHARPDATMDSSLHNSVKERAQALIEFEERLEYMMPPFPDADAQKMIDWYNEYNQESRDRRQFDEQLWKRAKTSANLWQFVRNHLLGDKSARLGSSHDSRNRANPAYLAAQGASASASAAAKPSYQTYRAAPGKRRRNEDDDDFVVPDDVEEEASGEEGSGEEFSGTESETDDDDDDDWQGLQNAENAAASAAATTRQGRPTRRSSRKRRKVNYAESEVEEEDVIAVANAAPSDSDWNSDDEI
jgi:hypothetical protein